MLVLILALHGLAADLVVVGDEHAARAADVLQGLHAADLGITVASAARSGTTAASLADPEDTILIDALDAHPDARWVWLTVGRQDLLNGLQERDDLAPDRLAADLQTTLERLQAARPDLRVLLQGYDLPAYDLDAACEAEAATLFDPPTPPALNQALTVVPNQAMVEVATQDVRWIAFDPIGTLQRANGVPGAPDLDQPGPAVLQTTCILPDLDGMALLVRAALDATFLAEPLPRAVIEVDSPVCVGQPTSALSRSTGAVRQRWTLDGEVAGTGVRQEVLRDTPGTTSVGLTAQGLFWDDTVLAEVVATAPTADAGPDVRVCVGQRATLGGTPQDGLRYAWEPAGSLDDATHPNPSSGAAINITYTLTVTDTDGCTAQDTVELTPVPNPVVEVSGPGFVQAERTVTLLRTISPDATASWEFAGATVLDRQPDRVTLRWDIPGTYMVTGEATSPDGCISTAALRVVVGEPDTGCGCASGSAPVAGWWLLWTGLLIAHRRRTGVNLV